MLFSKSANKPFPWCVRAQKERNFMHFRMKYGLSLINILRRTTTLPKTTFCLAVSDHRPNKSCQLKKLKFLNHFLPPRPASLVYGRSTRVGVQCRVSKCRWSLEIHLGTAKRIAKFSVNLQLIILWISIFFISPSVFLPIHVHVCHQLRVMTRTLCLITAM